MNIILAAMDPNGIIGNHGHMPWKDAQELALFKKLTMDHKILMGRTTWESLPQKLEGRHVIIATHDQHIKLDANENYCQDPFSLLQCYQQKKETLIVCGGRILYELALPYTDVLYLSVMKQSYPGDTRFPDWDRNAFCCVEKRDYPTFTWFSYKRKRGVLCDL